MKPVLFRDQPLEARSVNEIERGLLAGKEIAGAMPDPIDDSQRIAVRKVRLSNGGHREIDQPAEEPNPTVFLPNISVRYPWSSFRGHH